MNQTSRKLGDLDEILVSNLISMRQLLYSVIVMNLEYMDKQSLSTLKSSMEKLIVSLLDGQKGKLLAYLSEITKETTSPLTKNMK